MRLTTLYRGRRALAAATALTLAAPAARAAVLTTSPTAPATAAISQPDFSAAAFSGSQDFTDNAGPPGQTFTPAAALVLGAVTFKGFANTGASFGGSVNTGTWTITVSRVDAGNVLTRLVQETADPAAVTSGSDYVTMTLATPVALSAGTQYEVDMYSSTGYFGFAKSTTDVYAGGAAVQHGSTGRTAADGATITNVQGVDRTFFITAAVPEPGTIGLALAGGVALLARRGRTPR